MNTDGTGPLGSAEEQTVHYAFKAERYLRAISDIELNEAQKMELLGALWEIMRAFVELGFKVDLSVQVLNKAGLWPADESTERREADDSEEG